MKQLRPRDPNGWKSFIMREANYYVPPECEGGICVDAGSNVGDFPLNHGERFDKYVCYDVFPHNIHECEKNTKDLGVPVEVHKRAVWDSPDQEVKVYGYQRYKHEGLDYFGNAGSVGCVETSSMDSYGESEGWLEENQIDLVSSISLEEIVEQYGRIKLLKVDVEGSEYPFLLGKDLSQIDYIVGELHFSKEKQAPLVEWLKKFNKFNPVCWSNLLV